MAGSLKTCSIRGVRVNGYPASSGSRANVSLNAAFVNGTSGAAVSIRYECQSTDPISELYVMIDAHGGTLGNITMEAKIYNENTAAKPGTTVRDTSSSCVMPNADDKWIKFVFPGYAPTQGEILWITIYNTAAAPATDYPQILTATNFNSPEGDFNSWASGYSTSAGYSTNGTLQPKIPFVVKQGTAVFGNPFTLLTNPFSSNQQKRGIVVTPPVGLKVSAYALNSGSSALSGIQFYASTELPNSSPALASLATGADTNQVTDELLGGKVFSPITLLAGTTYYVVATFGSNSTIPSCLQIEDYSSYSAVFDEIYDGFNICASVIDDGSNGWTIDKSVSPAVSLRVSEFVASGGGGTSINVRRGMIGPLG